MGNELDQVIARLQNVPGWEIYQIPPGGGDPKPWYAVTGRDVVARLVIQDGRLSEQVSVVAAEIFHWSRLAATARRIWEIREREHRVWRDKMASEMLDPEGKPAGWKRPTEAAVTAAAHAHPLYCTYLQEVERAEEAYNATQAVVEGFRAQLAMLRVAVERVQAGAAPRLSV
jgi:hypothetical protein